MNPELVSAHDRLWSWCRKHDFAGYDPFDALNSRLFQATPFRGSRNARLIWTQLLKRSPFNVRGATLVPAERNPKGLALFALAALSNYRRLRTKEAEVNARELLDELSALQLAGFSGAAWGYNFPWQSRNFFAERDSPTIVPTAFAARAFIEASRAFEDQTYLCIARSACDFIRHDLKRSYETETEVCFSYSPNSKTRIFNASLLAAETLATVGQATHEEEFCQLALRAARYVRNQQHKNGSWSYGAEDSQAWVDNFHTAFLLGSLSRIIKACHPQDDSELTGALRLGYEYWRTSFFLADGWPKYYDDRLYPADAHAVGAAVVTLCDLRTIDSESLELAEKIAFWSIRNLYDPRGFFYYQRRRFMTVRTPFMRWSEAWMLYALARLLEERKK